MLNNQRQFNRISSSLPVQISVGSQITLQGQLRDLSPKSAFIRLKSSIYMKLNDELSFQIKRSLEDMEACVQGMARISRIAAGEGIAIYFVKMDENSTLRLKELVAAK